MSQDDRVKRWIRPAVLAASPYHTVDAGGMIKLDAMENPHPLPEQLRHEWLEALGDVPLNRYPEPGSRELKRRLRETFDVPPGAELLLGNGSDEIIQMIAFAVAAPGVTLLAPDPSFAMYRVIADVAGLSFAGVPLQGDDFALDIPAMLTAIRQHRPAVIFIARPNNPTGNLFDEGAVEEIVKAAPGLVVIDEAYHPFSGASLLPMLARHEHLLVMRTLSKLGLAGLRLGFVAGHPSWLRELEKMRLPYNVGIVTQASAAFFLEHYESLREQARTICADREVLLRRLAAMPGIRAWPSAANFILLRTRERSAAEVQENLRSRGVLVKKVDGLHPLLHGCLRITVGTADENAALLAVLSEVLDA